MLSFQNVFPMVSMYLVSNKTCWWGCPRNCCKQLGNSWNCNLNRTCWSSPSGRRNSICSHRSKCLGMKFTYFYLADYVMFTAVGVSPRAAWITSTSTTGSSEERPRLSPSSKRSTGSSLRPQCAWANRQSSKCKRRWEVMGFFPNLFRWSLKQCNHDELEKHDIYLSLTSLKVDYPGVWFYTVAQSCLG